MSNIYSYINDHNSTHTGVKKVARMYTVFTGGVFRTFTLAKSRRLLEHEDFETERRDLTALNDLAVGQSFTDTHGNDWVRAQ